jgi:phosphate-selective porin OprO/OprP
MGSAFTYWRNYWRISAGIFGQEIASWKDRKDNKQKNQSLSYAARLTAAPFNFDKKIIHLGGGYIKMKPDFESSSIDFDAYPETKVAPIKFLDTGGIDEVDYWAVYNLEGGAVYGSLSLQGEFMQTNVKRLNDSENLKFQGGYVFLSFFPTGESRPYSSKEGEFSQIIPRRKIGAFELAFRYSHLDLTDMNYEQPEGAEVEGDRVKGGKANNFTIGLNWYANPNVRLMTNYIFVDNSEFADGDGDFAPNDDFDFFQIRLLVNF